MINYEKVLSGLQYWSEYQVLKDIYYFFGTSEWVHNTANRTMLCTDNKIQPSTFKRNLKLLVEKNHLIKVRRGVYKVNEEILT